MRFGQGGLYAQAGAANYTPGEIDDMSFWQLAAIMGGFATFHGAPSGMSREDADEAAAMLDAHATRH